MSVTQTQITAAQSARPADRSVDDAFVQADLAFVEQLIADVLGRAHQAAEALDAPDEARTILQMVHSFADELAAMNPRFDRLRFIEAATGVAGSS
jgi:hypothetical protein